MSINSTRLRLFVSKDIEQLLLAVNGLPYKIEIKGQPVLIKGKWHLFFVPPDDDNPVVKRLPIITDIDGV